ncbi:MAG: sigma-70 family RNA polymerase sigma factor [Bacteroidota bacterium]
MSDHEKSLCDEVHFTGVFRAYAQTLHHYLFYQTGDDALAHDLTQEAFTRLWRNCKSVLFGKAQGYVFTIAKNLLKNKYQHQKVVLQYQQSVRIEGQAHDPQFLLEEKELAERLQEAIANLPEKQRVAFLMSRIDKMTYKEIAATLEISKQAVEKRIYNALDTLRKVTENIR